LRAAAEEKEKEKAKEKEKQQEKEGAEEETNGEEEEDTVSRAAHCNNTLQQTATQCCASAARTRDHTASRTAADVPLTLPPRCIAVCCGVLRCVAVCCDVLQCVAM